MMQGKKEDELTIEWEKYVNKSKIRTQANTDNITKMYIDKGIEIPKGLQEILDTYPYVCTSNEPESVSSNYPRVIVSEAPIFNYGKGWANDGYIYYMDKCLYYNDYLASISLARLQPFEDSWVLGISKAIPNADGWFANNRGYSGYGLYCKTSDVPMFYWNADDYPI